nr:divalent metal cation transporter [Phycisphaeraceae bacterium]
MSDMNKVEQDRALLNSVEGKGFFGKLGVFTKLSGPGWLQSAITLGGLSLATGLSLGIVGGYKMLWLQPLAMIVGIIMLGTIAYVTLSTGKSPFHQINRHISPVLGWGWLIATVMANCLWTMPQFSLAWAALDQAVVPAVPDEGFGKVAIIAAIALLCIGVIMLYDAPGRGVKIFETLLKIMVGIIVLSFVGAVAMLTVYGQLDWGQLVVGFIPD